MTKKQPAPATFSPSSIDLDKLAGVTGGCAACGGQCGAQGKKPQQQPEQ